MKVAILLKGGFDGTPEDFKRKGQQVHTAQAVARVLVERGAEVAFLPLSPPDFTPLEHVEADVLFNHYSATGPEQAIVLALLQATGLPYTGSSPKGHFLALNKRWAKELWQRQGLSTPAFFDDGLPAPADFPVIVKPVFGGSGEGVYSSSIVCSRPELEEHLAWMARYSPLLVERYVEGRELTASIFGDPPQALPILEVTFDRLPPELPPILSFEAKTRFSELLGVGPAHLSKAIEEEVRQVALQAFETLSLRDYARIDLRLDRDNKPWLIEANSLPGLEPDYSDFPRAAELAGLSYSELIWRLVQLANQRGGSRKSEPC